MSLVLNNLPKILATLGIKVEIIFNVDLQEFISVTITQEPDKILIHVQQPTFSSAQKQSVLFTIKESFIPKNDIPPLSVLVANSG